MADEHPFDNLIKRIKVGDPEARKELIEQAYGILAQTAREYLNSSRHRFLRDKGVETAEVVDEALLNRILKKDEFGKDLLDREDIKDGATFITEVARRIEYALRDLQRQYGKVKKKRLEQKSNAPSPETGFQPVEEAPQPSGKHEKWLAVDEEYNRVLSAMDSLSDEQKEVFRLRRLMSMTRQQVAESLGIDERTVTRRYRTALERLGEILKSEFPD